MTRYDKGRRLEYKTRDRLRDDGFTVVRSAGSKGPVDIVAFSAKVLRLIQVKANAAPGPAERDVLRHLPRPPGASVEIWVWHDHASGPMVMLVGKAGVREHTP
ncbi:MAG: hypothetical protein QGH59_05765 [Gemmatimonadota bacterium]|nr:hypothetical protein [Gemmatimonadota bacterium]